MDGTGEHHAKKNELGSKDERSHIFLHMWKLDLYVQCMYKYIYDHIFSEKQNKTVLMENRRWKIETK
jgi:hypothetical protein